MQIDISALEQKLNAKTKEERLDALRELIALENEGKIDKPQTGAYVNNHIHTIYSFSPYSPTAALYFARKAGLITAGIMDHDSVSGCKEFIEAGEIASMAVTCGFECRVRMDHTSLAGIRTNNPDQKGVSYVAIHGIPHQMIDKCEEFLKPYRDKRNMRNREMTKKINEIVAPYGLSIDFDKDIAPISQSYENGSITERHILCALANKIIEKCTKGAPVVDFIKNSLNISLSEKIEGFLSDDKNPHYIYDLLGVLKSNFVSQFFIDAVDECPFIEDYIAFANSIGAISAYAYLGDVGDSVTGDKKAQKFEDEYLDELFDMLGDLGFKAVTYMPSRNTMAQLERVMKLCEKYDLFQISGEDINTSRQSFICPALEKPEFAHLSTATWVLIGHEKAASKDIDDNMFSEKIVAKYPKIKDRIPYYENIGKN
ncbi:MAG: PHP domain-containing protein [Ruminococcaceae bacterium]|nr:PHP domain-containing protein [Oscillospiraceae bacterium]